MLSLFQIATGSSVPEEGLRYVVANNQKAILQGVDRAFDDGYNLYYGKFISFTLGEPNPHGCIPMTIHYIDEYGDEEEAEWELRPITAFL